MRAPEMLLAIDPSDVRPLYRQLADSVRGAIVAGELAPGDGLPPTREVAAALGVNAETVQRAYRLLADEAVVTSRVGRGTRVRADLDPEALALDHAIDRLVDRARRVGITPEQLAELVRTRAP
jgi:GntR family transcriptional regulator